MDDPRNCSELLFKNKTAAIGVLGVLAVVSSFSLFMNIFTVSVALYLKVYKHFAHRLAMYLVCSSILTNIVHISQLTLVKPANASNPCEPHMMFVNMTCNLIGPLRQYFMSVELLFAVCFTFHLFCLAVLQHDFKHLEGIYILVATVSPVFFVFLPYLWNAYGIDVAWCGIKSQNETGAYKDGTYIGLHFGIWYGPVFVLQIINAVEVIAILIAICYRLYSLKREREVLINRVNANKKALKELLPLIVYILIFLILTSLPFVFRFMIIFVKNDILIVCIAIVHVICDGLWGFNCSFAQLNHMYINRKLTRTQNMQSGFPRLNGLNDTATSYTELSTNTNTHFTVVGESDVDPFQMQ